MQWHLRHEMCGPTFDRYTGQVIKNSLEIESYFQRGPSFQTIDDSLTFSIVPHF